MSHSTTSSTFYVYKITSLVNSKLYIGVTSRTLLIRWKQHIKDSSTSDLALYRAIRKYGIDTFTIEMIEECPDQKTMFERERYWIQFYNTMLPNGYNVTAGGEGTYGMRHSEETKQKFCNKPITPQFREKMRIIANARAQNPEYIAKLREAGKGRHPSEAAIEKIREARAKQEFTSEAIEKRTQKLRGRTHTEISCAHMSAAQQGRYISPEHRIKIAETLQSLTNEQAAIIKFNYYGLMQKEYASLYNISVQSVNGIVKGRTYKHVTREHLPLSDQGNAV